MFHQNDATLNVAELFAGVGGFRLGLEAVHGSPFSITFSNQFEPSKKAQHASAIYQARWDTGAHTNQDIFELLESDAGRQAIRDAAPDVVVGGFPCQDYSVAKPHSLSNGLAGKKGVLWWSIVGLLQQRNDDGHPVKYLMLENVDRLISSPAPCRGRDFAVILSTLYSLGYGVEWRIVNAADYGHAQRRRRVFIVAYHKSTDVYQRMWSLAAAATTLTWFDKSVLNAAFPSVPRNPLDGVEPILTIRDDPFDEQLSYRPLANGKTRFANCGLMLDGKVHTCIAEPATITDFIEFTGHTAPLTLGDVVHKTGPVPTTFYLRPEDEVRWRTAKGAKNVARRQGEFDYVYSEGAMAFPDPLERPARTIITSEGGVTASRTKHVIRESSGRLRRLVPEELEELNGFPRGFTVHPGVSDVTRAMLMGNALVVGVVRRIGESLYRRHLEAIRA
ncbi:DNA (cytosine-5-)-methyltransferase [Burkholderia sp. PU8-34]